MGHSEADIAKHEKAYKAVLIALLILTVVTVAASYLKIGVALGIIIGLIIATVKGSLVAAIFMHLREEKSLIFWSLGFTMFFFFGMIGLILWHAADTPTYDFGYKTYLVPESVKSAHDGHLAHADGAAHADGHATEEGEEHEETTGDHN